MRTILHLFLEDLRSIKSNLMAVLVVMGLLLIPALYAWFNTLGFWDPYSATGQIEVAVANSDEGYQSDLLPARVNAGEEIVSQLRANDQFKWVFTSEEDAVDGVRSGAYYAALVIPSDFTAKLFTLFSPSMSHADIIYYTNQKENAVAPRVTTEGANALETQIDQTFTKTVSSVALETSSNLMSFMNGDGIANYAHLLDQRLTGAVTMMNEASTEADAFASLLGSTASMARAASEMLRQTDGATNEADQLLDEVGAGLDEGVGALEGAAAVADEALAQLDQGFDAIDSSVNAALDSLASTPAAAESTLAAISSELGDLISSYEEAREAVSELDPNSAAITAIDQAIGDLQTLQADLAEAQSSIRSGASSLETARERIQASLESARSSIHGMQNAYEEQLYQQSARLQETMGLIRDDARSLGQQLDETASALASSSDSLAGRLDAVRGALGQTATTLTQAASSLSQTQAELQAALASGDLDELRRIIGSDPTRIADFISAPTELNRQAVYPVANNGSAMAPFYTSLSIWIGSIFMVALMETVVGKRRRASVGEARPSQLYLGRYAIFMLFALIQATVVCLGNLWFLGIQCVHPFLYLVSGWVSAIVFSNIVYTLTLSFGKVGESIAIILLVLQVAGSGGIFPVVMSSDLFQVIYPFLPFTHAMAAFQSCIAGIYDHQFLMSIGMLLLFLVPMLILGLLLRKPMINLNEMLVAKMEETKLL